MLARLLAGSVVLTWPALLVVDQSPSGGVLNGKADDFLTGGVIALLIVGLLAAGWLKPRWAVLGAVLFLGFGVPMLYEALQPTHCPEGESGMDCIPVSFSAAFALPGVLLVLMGSIARSAARLPQIELLPSRAAGGVSRR